MQAPDRRPFYRCLQKAEESARERLEWLESSIVSVKEEKASVETALRTKLAQVEGESAEMKKAFFEKVEALKDEVESAQQENRMMEKELEVLKQDLETSIAEKNTLQNILAK